MLADSVTELFAARSMVYETARSIDDGDDRKVLHARCSMIKLYASEMAGRVADRAVQIFGGRGYMRENVAERFYRELRVERIWEGASEIQRVIVADQLAKRGRRTDLTAPARWRASRGRATPWAGHGLGSGRPAWASAGLLSARRSSSSTWRVEAAELVGRPPRQGVVDRRVEPQQHLAALGHLGALRCTGCRC